MYSGDGFMISEWAISIIFIQMQLLKQLGTLIEQVTNDANSEPPVAGYEKILDIINSRVDMPKHTINGISKRLSIKNKKVLFFCFDLLEYLSYRCELALYSQISSKEFLLKISGLLMAQDIDPAVQTKILQTVRCWEELFRPHQDLLPMFFQFYAGLLRKEFPIQTNYVSPYRPKDFKIYKKTEAKKQEENREKPSKPVVQPTKTEQKTFEEIRNQLIVTNQVISNANPAESVKSNELLLQMMEGIKNCEKRINQTINENPNEKIMELALAINDDICITYRRFKDLQKNRKPQPFFLTELASDIEKEKQAKVQKVEKVEQKQPQQSKPKDIFEEMEEKPKSKVEQKKPVEVDIFDIACEPKKPAKTETTLMDLTLESSAPPSNKSGVDIFDLLGGGNEQSNPSLSPSVIQTNSYMSNSINNNNQYSQPNMGSYPTNTSPNFTGLNFQSSNYANVSLQQPFQTENDLKKYDDKNIIQKLTELDIVDLSDIMKKK